MRTIERALSLIRLRGYYPRLTACITVHIPDGSVPSSCPSLAWESFYSFCCILNTFTTCIKSHEPSHRPRSQRTSRPRVASPRQRRHFEFLFEEIFLKTNPVGARWPRRFRFGKLQYFTSARQLLYVWAGGLPLPPGLRMHPVDRSATC